MVGTVLGDRYELQEKIGEGGMAWVYAAHCKILNRTVAVKILKDEFSKDQALVDKFRTEALAAARLSHPNIVNIFDVGREEDIHYIVMEYVEGTTLEELIKEEAPLSVERTIEIGTMICEGIQHAHDKGIIHRDIKPHNILITSQNIVKVADFGIAQAINKKTITFGGDIEGSVHYISPEQAKGEPVSLATDIYSLGCVLYEMLIGHPPFDAESMITVALKHIHDKPVPPSSINPDIPFALERIILKAMEKTAVYRFQSAREMCDELQEIKKGLLGGLGEGEDGSGVRRRKLSPLGIIIVVSAVLGLLSGILYVFNDSLFGDEVPVPNVEGKDWGEASKLLEKEGLVLDINARNFDPEVKKDLIISQDPAAGINVKKGRKIKVTISKGPELLKVPNLVGKDVADAKLIISNEQFEEGPIDYQWDNTEKGKVISQDPKFGASAEKGTAINLMVSKGKAPEKVAVPKLVGLTLDQARAKLTEKNLNQGETPYQESAEYYSGYIIDQEIEEGVLVDEETAIDLTVSKGPGPVAKTRNIEFTLPTDKEIYQVVIIVKDQQEENTEVIGNYKGGTTIYRLVKYNGSGTAQVQLDGVKYGEPFELP